MAEDKSVEIILYEQIELALEDLLTEKTIRSVEIWNEQITNESTERPRQYPYVGVQIDTEWMGDEAYNSIPNIKQNQQKGNCTIIIHYIYESLQDETQTWLTQRAHAHTVHRALNGLYYDQYFVPLIRTSTPHEDSHDRVSDIQITYMTQIIECGITDEDAHTVASGDWEIEHQNDLDIDNDTIRTGDGE